MYNFTKILKYNVSQTIDLHCVPGYPQKKFPQKIAQKRLNVQTGLNRDYDLTSSSHINCDVKFRLDSLLVLLYVSRSLFAGSVLCQSLYVYHFHITTQKNG